MSFNAQEMAAFRAAQRSGAISRSSKPESWAYGTRYESYRADGTVDGFEYEFVPARKRIRDLEARDYRRVFVTIEDDETSYKDAIADARQWLNAGKVAS